MSDYRNTIAQLDPENLYDVLLNSHQQIEYALSLEIPKLPAAGTDFNSIIVSGLGGSAIAGDFLRNFAGEELYFPYSVNRNYNLPAYAGKNTLLIISSYSGNTEESIAAFEQGLSRGCKIVCLTTGGTIGKMCSDNNVIAIPLKKGYQPRYAFGVSFFTLLRVVAGTGAIPPQDEIIRDIATQWRKNASAYSATTSEQYKIAEGVSDKVPVIYSFADTNESVGYRLKCQFNENSKVNAFTNIYPEYNHNEIVGWETHNNADFKTAVITFEEETAHTQLKKRDEICSKLIAQKDVPLFRIKSSYGQKKYRLADAILQADWVSFHTAILRGKDPGEIDNIHFLKAELAR